MRATNSAQVGRSVEVVADAIELEAQPLVGKGWARLHVLELVAERLKRLAALPTGARAGSDVEDAERFAQSTTNRAFIPGIPSQRKPGLGAPTASQSGARGVKQIS